jgi:hypothetical protein
MKRIRLMLARCLVFASFGANLAVAQTQNQTQNQTLNHPDKDQQVVPQSLVPAQPPSLPQPPGFLPASPTNKPATQSEVHAKKPGANQPVQQATAGANQTAKEPERTKVARVYPGNGSFDAALAEKLRPMLAKAFPPAKNNGSPNNGNPVSKVIGSISGNPQPAKDENPAKMATAAGGL